METLLETLTQFLYKWRAFILRDLVGDYVKLRTFYRKVLFFLLFNTKGPGVTLSCGLF